MSQTNYVVKFITQFRKDYKLAIKRGLKIELLEGSLRFWLQDNLYQKRIK